MDDLVGALRELPTVQLDRLPRMADFARWGVAAERGRGEVERPAVGAPFSPFLRAYRTARAASHELAVAGSLIGPHLLRIIEGGAFDGTAGELRNELDKRATDAERRAKGWPHAPRMVADELRRLSPALRALGFSVEMGGRGAKGRRRIRLDVEEPAASSSPASPASPTRYDRGDEAGGEVAASGDEVGSAGDEVEAPGDDATRLGDAGDEVAALSDDDPSGARWVAGRLDDLTYDDEEPRPW